MYIVQLAPECVPAAKIGGLADVVRGLSRELELRGHAVEIILPKYDTLALGRIWNLQPDYHDLWVPWNGGHIHCTVWFGFAEGLKCFFIDPHSQEQFFNRGQVYGQGDDDLRFAFFCRAAMEFMLKSGKRPDILHVHDWSTALAPVLLYEMYAALGLAHTRACFTIHNLKHQGTTGPHLLQACGLHRPEYFLHYDRMRDNFSPGAVNLMKGGIVYSNAVTTVSPRYADEILSDAGGQSHGLGHTLQIHRDKIEGILNGVDYDLWNPTLDPHLPAPFNEEYPENKRESRRALQMRLGLKESPDPIVISIGRLDPQKGPHLIRHALFHTLAQGGQFVLLGSATEPGLHAEFGRLAAEFADHPDARIVLQYNEDLAHLMYAGADLIVVPSLFEPCGLTQLIALKYGTLPVVRKTGGLADTVFDADFSTVAPERRNGFVFNDYDEPGIESALGRAIACFRETPDRFHALMDSGMRCDYSWNQPGRRYLEVYERIREK